MRRTIYILCLMLAIAASATGCSSKKSGSGGGSGYPGYPDGGGNGTVPPMTDPDTIIGSAGGETVALTMANKPALDAYVGGWTTNNPTDLKVTISLTKQDPEGTPANADHRFGGYISITFKDGTSNFKDSFSSLHLGGSNCGWLGDCNTTDDNVENHKYNLLSTGYPELGGNFGYHGFFEDTRVQRLVAPYYGQTIFGGAVILVIDSMNDAGDGQGPTSANGSIWFKNYSATYPQGPLPLTNCWFISKGPYDCRSWPNDGKVNTKASIYPTNGYTKLGSFIGLDIKKAFNNEI